MTKKLSKNTEGGANVTKVLNFRNVIAPITILFLILFFQNCAQPTEGCLDLRATNFDVTASIPCSKNCQCTYPSLVVAANYMVDTNNFSYLKTYYRTDVKDSFQIISHQFYLSDFQLINAQNQTFRTIDSVALTRAKDTIKVLNNYALAGKSNGFNFTIGSFNSVGNFTKIKFRLGLDSIAAKTVPTKMPFSHPLSLKADSMYISSAGQYIYNKFVIAHGVNFKDTLRLNITQPVDLVFTNTLTFTEGFNANIPLRINYLEFFTGVKFTSTPDSIIQKIIVNTRSAFSIQ